MSTFFGPKGADEDVILIIDAANPNCISTSGATTCKEIVNNMSGAYNNNPTWHEDGYWDFDGVDDSIIFSNTDDHPNYQDRFEEVSKISVAAWLSADDYTPSLNKAFSNGSDWNGTSGYPNGGVSIGFHNGHYGDFYAELSPSSTYPNNGRQSLSGGSFTDGEWSFICYTIDLTTPVAKRYVFNNTMGTGSSGLVGTSTSTSNMGPGTWTTTKPTYNKLGVGSGLVGGAYWFAGKIAMIKFWAKTLSEEEVKNEFRAHKHRDVFNINFDI